MYVVVTSLEKCNGSRSLFCMILSEISNIAKGCCWHSKVKAVGSLGEPQVWCRWILQVTVSESDMHFPEIPNAKCVHILYSRMQIYAV